jgi:signal transduction histidine kinase/DNA-binding response OmpR family regulator
MLEPLAHYTATAVVTLICAMFSWPMYWANRKVPGTLWWAIANSVLPTALICLSSQPYAPVWLGVVLANHLLFLHALLLVYGTWLFFGQKPRFRLLSVIAVCFSLPFLYFSYVSPNTDARIVLGSLMFIATLCFMVQSTATRPKGEFTVGAILIYSVLGTTFILMLYRIIHVLFIGSIGNIFTNTTLNTVVAGISYFNSYGLTLSFYMLCHEKQLQHIKELRKEAQQQTEQKSRFLAFLSHELRTPLNAIVGKAQLIALNTTSTQIQHDCSLIADAGMSLSTMAKQILEHSRLEHGNVSIELSDVQPGQWLKRMQDMYLPMAQAKSLEIRLEVIHDTGLSYSFDQGKIQQVLTNLLANAIKYSDKGSIVLKAEILHSDNKIRFHVTDQGIGISDADQSILLQPFTRAGNSQNREGAGLGLSLSQNILAVLGSRLCFSSELGKGSHFYFEIDVSAATEPSQKADIAVVQSLFILLVEDVELNQQIIGGMLEQDQHAVLYADSVQQALKLATANNFDLILLDMNLPDGNGIQFYQQLCKHSASPPATVMLTADISEELKTAALGSGIRALLHKPITLASLRQCLSSQFLDKNQQPPRLAANFATFMQIAKHLPAQSVHNKLNLLHHELLSCIEQIKQALPDYNQTKTALHRLTSLSATLGFEHLTDTCSALEQQVQQLGQQQLSLLSTMAEDAVNQLKEKVKLTHD